MEGETVRGSILSLIYYLFFFLSYRRRVRAVPGNDLGVMLASRTTIAQALPRTLSSRLQRRFAVRLLHSERKAVIPRCGNTLESFKSREMFGMNDCRLGTCLKRGPSLTLSTPCCCKRIRSVTVRGNGTAAIAINYGMTGTLTAFRVIGRRIFSGHLGSCCIRIDTKKRSIA